MLRRKSQRIQHRRLFHYETIICFLFLIVGNLGALFSQPRQTSPRKQFFKAESLFQKKDVLKAQAIWEKLLLDSSFDEKASAYFRLSQCFWEQGKFPQTHYYAQKAVEIEPSNESYLIHLAHSWEQQYLYDSALSIYKELIKLKPRYISRYKRAMDASKIASNWESSISIGNKWVEAFGRSEYISKEIFQAHLALGDTNAAIEEVELLLKRLPHRRDIKDWIEDFKGSRNEKPKRSIPKGFEVIVEVYDQFMLEDWIEANRICEETLSSQPNKITLHKMRLYATFMAKDVKGFEAARENTLMLFPFLEEIFLLEQTALPYLKGQPIDWSELGEVGWIGLIKAEGLRQTGSIKASHQLFEKLLEDIHLSKPFIKERINKMPLTK